MIFRFLALGCFAIAILATVAWVGSHLHPTKSLLLRAERNRAIFFTSRSGVISVWTQEIAPPPPTGCALKLTTPCLMSVTRVDPGGHGRRPVHDELRPRLLAAAGFGMGDRDERARRHLACGPCG